MTKKLDLHMDWCYYSAAKYAVEKWHYSKSLPAAGLVKVGAWEFGEFVGCIIYSKGAAPHIGVPYGLPQNHVCELTRIALRKHVAPVSRMIAVSLKMLKRINPEIRLVVSFADMAQKHYGIVYQASNWVYVGTFNYHMYRVYGKIVHPRTLYGRYGRGGQSIAWLRRHVDRCAVRVISPPKHKYVMPLDADMRKQVLLLARPYPKCVGSDTSDTTASQAVKGGAAPTPALV